MRLSRLLLAPVVALSLTGCATTGITPGEVITGIGTLPQSELINQIRNRIIAGCQFVPTASFIAALITQGGSVGISEIANAVCAAVRPPVAAGAAPRARRVPTVNGIVVQGKFLR